MRRRDFLAFTAAAAFAPSLVARALAAAGPIDVEAILNDPEAPVGGNPQGDVTIVAFLDYNCPFCKKAAPALERIVATDGRIRLIYKDWPILSEASVYGARMALAAKYQGKYEQVHAALMAIHGRGVSEARMEAAIRGSGVDMTQLQADLAAHDGEISALLKRNLDEADSLGLVGTPVFLVGPFKIAAALDLDGFKRVVEQTRARQHGAESPAQ